MWMLCLWFGVFLCYVDCLYDFFSIFYDLELSYIMWMGVVVVPRYVIEFDRCADSVDVNALFVVFVYYVNLRFDYFVA